MKVKYNFIILKFSVSSLWVFKLRRKFIFITISELRKCLDFYKSWFLDFNTSFWSKLKKIMMTIENSLLLFKKIISLIKESGQNSSAAIAFNSSYQVSQSSLETRIVLSTLSVVISASEGLFNSVFVFQGVLLCWMSFYRHTRLITVMFWLMGLLVSPREKERERNLPHVHQGSEY